MSKPDEKKCWAVSKLNCLARQCCQVFLDLPLFSQQIEFFFAKFLFVIYFYLRDNCLKVVVFCEGFSYWVSFFKLFLRLINGGLVGNCSWFWLMGILTWTFVENLNFEKGFHPIFSSDFLRRVTYPSSVFDIFEGVGKTLKI